MSLIPVIMNWPLALLPVHVLFLELIIDPACTVVFEMENDEQEDLAAKECNRREIHERNLVNIRRHAGVADIDIGTAETAHAASTWTRSAPR